MPDYFQQLPWVHIVLQTLWWICVVGAVVHWGILQFLRIYCPGVQPGWVIIRDRNGNKVGEDDEFLVDAFLTFALLLWIVDGLLGYAPLIPVASAIIFWWTVVRGGLSLMRACQRRLNRSEP